MKKNTKIILSVVAIVALIIGSVVGVNLINRSKQSGGNKTVTPTVTPAAAVTPGATDPVGKDTYTVSFALPADTTQEQAKATKLPAPVQVAPGTLISTLEQPVRTGGMFLGWYYDESKLLAVSDTDTVDRNLTLYPRFATKEGFGDEFSVNFVSNRDVAEDFKVEVVAYHMTKEQLSAALHVWNVSQGKKPEMFRLIPVQNDTQNISYLVDENGKVLRPEKEDSSSVNTADEDNAEYELPEALSDLAIDLRTATEAELKKFYDVAEEDSLIRFLREERGMDIEAALQLQTQLRKNSEPTDGVHYIIESGKGGWQAGELFQVEISDTEKVRFYYNGEVQGASVNLYNFSVTREEINTLVLRDGMVFIPLKDVEGVALDGGLMNIIAGSDKNGVEKNTAKGTMTYAGALTAGTVVAIYDGTLKADNTVDGDISYFEITKVLGGNRYEYTIAQFEDVVFIPDVIPVQDDGSFSDGKITVAKSSLSFGSEVYRKMNLSADTKVEPGDFIAVYTGKLTDAKSVNAIGYGRIKTVTAAGGNVEIVYDIVTLTEVLDSFQMHTAVENVNLPVDETLVGQMKSDMLLQAKESGIVEESALYVMQLVSGELPGESEFEHADELKKMTFNTDDGRELTLEEVRLLADGGVKNVKVSDPTVNFAFSPTLQHFSGEGARLEVSVGFKIEIELNTVGSTVNKLEIKVDLALQQEIVLGLDINVDAEWDWYAIIPILQEVNVDAAVRAGTYTGFGATATVTTGKDNTNSDTEWNKLITSTTKSLDGDAAGLVKLGEKLEELSKDLKTVQNGGGYTVGKDGNSFKTAADDGGPGVSDIGGDLPSKYSGMLSNDAKYVNLVKMELFRLPISPDPFHLIEFSIEADFVVSLKVNCMIGTGISYANAKQYCYNIKVLAKEATSSEADLETPNFRADFYVFGMIGARVGILLDARVGLISTKMDSIGITAEAGFYAELYGFLYVFFTWESGKGTESGAMGSMLFEVGMYLDVNFLAQLGGGKLSTGTSIYSNRWPFWQFGAVDVPIDFVIEKNDASLSVEIPTGKSTVKVPDDLFKMNVMGLKNGKLSAVSKDSAETGEEAYRFTIRDVEYIQYSEENYDVICQDTDAAGNILKTHSFQYLPATNEIYVKPEDNTADEAWGIVTFTYKNESFGFNTVQMKRTVKVHWKGQPATAVVEYYKQQDDGSFLKFKEGEFDGFDGITYDLMVDEDFVYQVEGYRLSRAYFPDIEELAALKDKMHAEYKVAEAAYQKTGGKTKRLEMEAAAKKYTEASERYHNYWTNNDDVIAKKHGTMQFKMINKNTVVKLYFKPVSTSINYVVDPEIVTYVESMDANGNPIYKEGFVAKDNMATATVALSKPILGTLPSFIEDKVKNDARYEYSWYMFTYEYSEYNDRSGVYVMHNRDRWIKLDENSKVPEVWGYTYVLAVPEKTHSFTATFKADDKVVAASEVMYNTPITLPQEPEKKGHTFDYWVDAATGKRVDDTTLMPGEDTVYTAVWHAKWYKINCKVNNSSWSLIAPYGESLMYAINSDPETGIAAPAREEYSIQWYIVGADGTEAELELSHRVPDMEVSVRGEYVLSKEHTHVWDEGRITKSAQCFEEGERTFMCAVCGAQKKESIAKTDYHPNRKPEGGIDPTCDKPGKYDDEICIDCGKAVVVGEVIPATGRHDFSTFTVEPGNCVTPGEMHYFCSVCNVEKVETLSVNPDRHTGVTRVINYVEAGCSTQGYTGDVVCADCGKVLTSGEAIWSKGGHDFINQKYEWSADYSTVTATAICSRDGVTAKETVTTEKQVLSAVDCENDGVTVYTAKFTNDAFTTQEETVTTPKTGHAYGTVTYTWSEDGTSCTAERVCENDAAHKESETVSAMKTGEFLGDDGSEITTYKAFFTNKAFEAQSHDVVKEGCKHEWNAASYSWSADHSSVTAKTTCKLCKNELTETVTAVKSVKTAATCETDGELLYTATFKNAAFTEQTYTDRIAKTGHAYGEVTYTWSADYATCKAERVCANNAAHKETETVSTVSEEKYISLGQKQMTYTAVFKNSIFGTKEKKALTDVTPETPEISYLWTADHGSVTATAVYRTIDSTVTETVTARRNETPATCEKDGEIVYKAEFENALFEDQTYREVLTKTGHSYGTATYTWAADYSTCTAEVVCANDANHKLTETVSAVVDATVDKGQGMQDVTYKTAAFTNSIFSVQTKTVEVNTCQHVYSVYADDYGKITLRESAGGSYVSVDGTTHYTISKGAWEQYTCTKCGHVKTEEVKGFIDYPPRITLSALNAAGYRTVGDVINAGPSTFGRYFESVGEFMTESGATVDVVVPGSHAVTGFHYFDNEKSEFVTKEQFLEIVGGEDAVLTNGIGLSFVVTFYPSDSSYFVAPMEADMNFYY